MFSGIVQQTGLVKHRRKIGDLVVVEIVSSLPSVVGSSVLVNGVCSTVAGKKKNLLRFEYVPETPKKTTVSQWRVGQRLNLEPSLRLGDEISGHFVFGHVDGRGAVKQFMKRGSAAELVITAPSRIMKFLAPKGSICLDGVSLTIVTVGRGQFSVALIPHTLHVTTLNNLTVGSQVNIEVDMLARYVGIFCLTEKFSG